ncbi:MAG: efflux RND transporter periplasmic adaptor subunit [Pseudomonadota bacterium]
MRIYTFGSKSLLLLAMAVVSVSACKGKQGKDSDKDDNAVTVQVMQVAPEHIANILRYDADLRGELEVKVFSQVPEKIVSLYVEEGDQVKKGQVLAEVRADTLGDNVRSAVAAREATEAERDNLKNELARQEKLFERKVVSSAQVDQVRAQLLSVEAQIRRLTAMANQASTVRADASIRSPIDGVVGRRFLSKGDLALPSLPVFTVVQMDRVELYLEAPEKHLAFIKKGMTAVIRVARYSPKRFLGEVVRVSPVIDRTTRTARITVFAENKERLLMPGMLARVQLELERRENVVVVPYSSLIIETGTGGEVAYRVFVVEQNKAVERSVSLGIVQGGKVEIREGLAFGETLVTRGQHLLKKERAVEITERLAVDGKIIPVSKPKAHVDKTASGSKEGSR